MSHPEYSPHSASNGYTLNVQLFCASMLKDADMVRFRDKLDIRSINYSPNT